MTSATQSPFHDGEREAQSRVGLRDKMEKIGQVMMRDHMIEQHRLFYPLLPMIIAGYVDNEGQPWCSMLVGEPGFIQSPDDRHLQINTAPLPGDPIRQHLQQKSEIGLLGIELPTRRRNRLNGVVNNVDEQGISVEVVQSFGNCPKYIHTRSHEFVHSAPETTARQFSTFDSDITHFIATSDTFFVASHAQDSGVDASHRGGNSGFVRVEDERTLTIPDYAGNNLFNTLGNFIANPKAGMLFPNFETGDLLMLTGSVEILWDSPATADFDGAQRLWRFTLSSGHLLSSASPLRWHAV